jgi:regulator of protease activity HflC (stomatin/prohibitin superfamily)
VITRDNVPAKVNAVAYFRVIDPVKSVIEVERIRNATSQIAQTTLRSVLGKADLDTLLSERETLNESLQQIIDDQTDPWGVKVTTVEIKDVGIPQGMQRAMARQAEAERERRAKIINAEGEAQAAAKLAEAADVIGRNPVTLQLRYLQTLREIGGGQNSTIVFPVDVVRPVLQALGGAAAASGDASVAVPQPSGTAQLDAMVADQLEAARRAQLGPGAAGAESSADRAPGAASEPAAGDEGSAGA